MKFDVIIIGAGIAGLTTALYLKKAGKNILVLDAADKVGGQLISEKIEGFTLDYGFRVLLSESPELERVIDIERLKPQKFSPGVYINLGEQPMKLLADPSRLPNRLFSTLFNGVGSVGDKFKLWSLKLKLRQMTVDEIFLQSEMSAQDALKSYGFSNSFVEKFLKPFFGGIFMDTELNGSRKMFDFYFKMLCEGNALLPEDGIETLAQQMAERLAGSELGLNTNVVKIDKQKVIIENGMEFTAPVIVLATENTDGIKGVPHIDRGNEETITTFYYKYSNSPFDESFPAVNGLKDKLINHIAVITDVSSRYSYTSDALISVNVIRDKGLSDDILAREVKKELKEWFGPAASYWELIKYFKVRRPIAEKVSNTLLLNHVVLNPFLFKIGDFSLNGSINGAFSAGRQLAMHITGEKMLDEIKEVRKPEIETEPTDQE